MRQAELRARLEQDGILLLSDARRPSVVSLVVGAPVRGSWWPHPRGKEIFALASALAADRDTLTVKLVDGKVTFVHRRLWPAVLALARAREPARLRGLSAAARRLLARVETEGTVEAHGAAVKELEERLLVHSAQVHTQRGSHAVLLTDWDRWARAHGPLGRALPLARAKAALRPWLG